MNRLYSMPIRALLFLIVFVVALPSAGIIAHTGFKLRREALDRALLDTRKIVESIAIEQQHLVNGAEQLMTAIAQLPEVKQHDAAKTVPILRELRKLNPMYANITVADRDGTVWATALPVKGPFNVADRRYFKNALASGQLSSGEYVISRATSKPIFNLGIPLKDDRGETIGVVGVALFLDRYRDLLARMQMPAGANAVIIDYRGIILSRAVNPGPFIGKAYFPKVFKRIQEGPEVGAYIRAGLEGDKRIISHLKLRLQGEPAPYMYVTSGIPVDVILKQTHKTILTNVMLFTSVLAAAFFLAWRIGKHAIADRVTLLEQASRQLAKGDLDVRVSGRVAGGELGNLGEAFDAMAGELAARTEALRESERNYREIFNATHDAIFVHDAESGEILEANDLAKTTSGFTGEEMQ
ncbi:MAG TPA: cache domain-containing protein, partial [Geobacteraceae bacterium]